MLITGVRREGVFPDDGQLNENVRIERPAVVLDFVIARVIEVGDSTDDERIITSSLFGKDRISIGRNVAVVGNVQSNGKVLINEGSTIFGNVVAKEVKIGTGVNIVGNVIADAHITIGKHSKIGGYVASINGSVKVEDGVEVFDVFGYSGVLLGRDIHAMDYALYGGRNGTQVGGRIVLGKYHVSTPEAIKFQGSLNLLMVLLPDQYNPRNSLKYLRESLGSIIDVKTYLEKHNIDIQKLEREFQIKPLEEMLKKMAGELAQTLSMARPSITVTNASGPVTITIGNNNVVSVDTDGSDRHRTVNLVELFQKARESIVHGDLPTAYSAVASIREAALKEEHVPEELDELINAIKVRIREGITPSEEIKDSLISLLDAAYNKMLKL